MSANCQVIRNIKYTEFDDPQRSLDLYLPKSSKNSADDSAAPPLFVFVHGGAWMSEDKSDHSNFGLYLASLASNPFAVAVINYRLCPRRGNPKNSDQPLPDPLVNPHPTHAQDCAAALRWLLEHSGTEGAGAEGRRYDVHRVTVAGHSAGAWIAAMISLRGTQFGLLEQHLRENLRVFVGLEGIYDLPKLAQDYPLYADWFLSQTFGPDRDSAWANASPQHVEPIANWNDLGHAWLIVQSPNDELINMAQAKGFYSKLAKEMKRRQFREGDEGADDWRLRMYEDEGLGSHDAAVKKFGSEEEDGFITKQVLLFIQKNQK